MDYEPYEALTVGTLVRALRTITESGDGDGDPKAIFPADNYIHALEGDLGCVVHAADLARDTPPTVRFASTGTATIVHESEIDLMEMPDEIEA